MDILAGAVEVVGLYLVGNKRKIAFLLGLLANLIWIGYVLAEGHTYGLLLVCVPAAVVNTRNWFKWRAEEKCR